MDGMAKIGQGYSTEFGGLLLEVAWLHYGSGAVWQYKIMQPPGNEVLTNWTPVGEGPYQEQENAKYRAIADALGQLSRGGEDAHAVFNNTQWQPFGPGHAG